MRKCWVDDEISYLRENAQNLTISQLAEKLGRSYTSVKKKLTRLKLKHKSLRRRWTAEEDEVLREAAGKVPYFKLAARLDRSPARIAGRIYELGLKTRHRFFSDAELKEIQRLLKKHWTVPQISEALGRSECSVRYSMHRENLAVVPKPVRLTETQAAYIAGLVDGEGTVTVTIGFSSTGRPYVTPVVYISGTDEYLYDWLRETLETKTSSFNQAEAFKLQLYNPRLLPFLERIRPYLIVKRPQTDLLLELLRNKKLRKLSRREIEIAIELRRLNLRNYSNEHGQLLRIQQTVQRLRGFLASHDGPEF